MPADTPFMTTEELAQRWRTTPGGIANLRYRGEAPRGTRIGRRVLYRLADVVAFEETRGSASSENRRLMRRSTSGAPPDADESVRVPDTFSEHSSRPATRSSVVVSEHGPDRPECQSWASGVTAAAPSCAGGGSSSPRSTSRWRREPRPDPRASAVSRRRRLGPVRRRPAPHRRGLSPRLGRARRRALPDNRAAPPVRRLLRRPPGPRSHQRCCAGSATGRAMPYSTWSWLASLPPCRTA